MRAERSMEILIDVYIDVDGEEGWRRGVDDRCFVGCYFDLAEG